MSLVTERKPISNRSMALMACGWLLISLFVGETQLLKSIPGPAVPLIVWSLTIALLTCYFLHHGFRLWMDQTSSKFLVAIHLVRFVGFYFLYLKSHGRLPAQFALPAGWGDILVAILAIPVLLFARPAGFGWGLLSWNILGCADILYVVITAARMMVVDPRGMAEFTTLPLSFLPTMIVPVIISTHVILFIRLARGYRKEALSAIIGSEKAEQN
ncbi:MAG: hypothetical protein SFY81_09005 [Verrucomicrobiota bacterium]|nr:hypothetical protein [Verrucomicrobiota bacterium]